MKKPNFLASIALGLLLVSCGPTQNQAILYNDSLMDIMDKLTATQNLFMNQLDGHNVDSLKLTYKLFAEKTKTSIEEYNAVKPFKAKNELGTSVLELFTTLNTEANGNSKQLVELLSKDSTQYTESDNEKAKQLSKKFDEVYGKAYDKLVVSQTAFAKEWDFDLIKDKR